MIFAEAATGAGASQPDAPLVLSGRDAILRVQPRLQRFAEECGQPGAADYIDYFLTQPYTGSKTPHLLLFEQRDPSGGAPALEGAVLVHQYRLLGLPLGVFITEDSGGERNILGSEETRSALAVRAAHYLLRGRDAHLVVLSLQNGQFRPAAFEGRHTQQQWAFRRRTLLRRLPLLTSYTETLATLGPHTRRNFRLFRRRALAAYACSFVPQVELTRDEFVALNARCDYPVPLPVAHWRYHSVHAIAGGVLAGVRTANGEWISVVGGRRHHGTFVVDWQMNRADFARISPATLMRGFLIEHEGAEGTASLMFQGGTPHSMQSAFRPEHVVDLVGSSGSLPANLLRHLAVRARDPQNFLMQTLADSDLQWQPGIEG